MADEKKQQLKQKRLLKMYSSVEAPLRGSDIVCPAVLEMAEQDGSYPPRLIYSARYVNYPVSGDSPRSKLYVSVGFENRVLDYELDEDSFFVYVPESDIFTFSSRGTQYTIRALQEYDSSWLPQCSLYIKLVESKIEALNEE